MSERTILPAPPRRMLQASPAMKAAAQKAAEKLGLALLPKPELPPDPPANKAAKKPAPAEIRGNVSPEKIIDPEAEAWRKHRLEQRNALILALRKLAPDLFAGLERVHPPLAIGIREEILSVLPDTNKNVLSDVLRAHTSGQGYLTNLAAGQPRRHLDGSEAEPATPDAVTFARIRLAALQRKRQAQPKGPKPQP